MLRSFAQEKQVYVAANLTAILRAVGAAGAFLLAFSAGTLSWERVKESVFLTAKTTSMVCWLFVGSALFSAVFALLGGQALVEKWVLALNLTLKLNAKRSPSLLTNTIWTPIFSRRSKNKSVLCISKNYCENNKKKRMGMYW